MRNLFWLALGIVLGANFMYLFALVRMILAHCA